MKKNINILRIDFDIDEQNNFEGMNIRTNIDLPMEFNEKLNELFISNIDKTIEEIKEIQPNNTSIFDIFATALYNSGMTNGNTIINEQFLNARKMEYIRKGEVK